jgi:DNA-binding transcriptional regulator WhiA
MEIKQIAKELNVYKDYPSLVAKKHNIARGSGKKSTINPKLFIPGTAGSDYWIGYLIADGSIFHTNRNNNVSLSSVDEEIKIKFINYCGAHYYDRKTIHVMYFTSKAIVANLMSYGVTPKKSLTINLTIPLTTHILRGIFDGDGSVHNKRYSCKITTGSFMLGNQIVKFLEDNNIYSKLRLRRGTNHYDVWIERKEEFKNFFNLIYTDSNDSIQLNRKYLKFVALLSNG